MIQSELMFIPVNQNQPFFYDICRFMGSCDYSLVNLFNIRFGEDDSLQIKWADGVFIHRGWKTVNFTSENR